MGAQALLIAKNANSFIIGREDHQSDSPYDGTGGSISIPTLLIDEADGEKLIALVKGKPNFDTQVILKADIDITESNVQTISYTLFYGSIVDLDPSLILKMYEYQHALGDKAIFIPRILTFDCQTCP